MLRKISALLVILSFFQSSLLSPAIARDTKELQTLPRQKAEKKSTKSDYVEGEVIVKYRSEKKQKAAVEKFQSQKVEKPSDTLEVKDDFADLQMAVLKSDKKSTSEMLDELKKDATVEFAEPNYKKEFAYSPNDTYFVSEDQWAHRNTGQDVEGTRGTVDADIDTAEMWDIENSGAGNTIIAVLDDGVEYDNADLIANMWDGSAGCKDENNAVIAGGCPNHGYDFENNDFSPEAQYSQPFGLFDLTNFSHGTFVSSVIASEANNTRGIAGMSRYGHNKVMALRFGLDVASEIRAIHFAQYNGAKVINASFVGSDFSQSEKNAIDAFPGIFVTAAGNAGDDVGAYPQYPCTYSSANVICVGATDQNDALTSFSNYDTVGVDIAAPGENIAGLASGDNNYVAAYGTSFSTPMVAGVAGILYSQTPGASIATIRNTLLQSSDHKSALAGETVCGRRLNANAALANMQAGTVPTETCIPPIYRFYNKSHDRHFYTISSAEKNSIMQNLSYAWAYEGVGYHAHESQVVNTSPVYRFYNAARDTHFFTISSAERDSINANLSHAWKDEGIAYYAYQNAIANTTPIYRFYNAKQDTHFFTVSSAERDSINTNLSHAWKDEGIGYYVPNFQ